MTETNWRQPNYTCFIVKKAIGNELLMNILNTKSSQRFNVVITDEECPSTDNTWRGEYTPTNLPKNAKYHWGVEITRLTQMGDGTGWFYPQITDVGGNRLHYKDNVYFSQLIDLRDGEDEKTFIEWVDFLIKNKEKLKNE